MFAITLGSARRALGILTTTALIAAGLLAAQLTTAPYMASAAPAGIAPNEQRSASTVTADSLPTVQIDSGIVLTQIVIGTQVFAGGTFTNARPAGATPGTGLMPRSNILAYNIATGVATSFAPVINGTVRALAASPDGTRLYVGGTFTTVNGQSRFNVAAFDVATGALLSTFKPPVGGSYVNAIVATNSTVYVGGLIGAGNGVTRKNLAAFSTSGALLTWAPTTDLQVDAMVLAPTRDKIIVGGRFSQVNGVVQRGLAALDLVTGSILPWLAPASVKNGWGEGIYKGKAGIFALTADSTNVYGTGWVYATAEIGNLEGTFSAESGSGAITWVADCLGDHYGVYSDGTNVYTTSHQHACETIDGPPQAYPAPGNLRHATAYTAAAKGTLTRSPYVGVTYADWSGTPAPAAINWYPNWTTGTASGQGQAGWTVTGNGTYVVIGGEFPFVNGKTQQGLARFSNAPPGGAKEGPRLSGNNWTGISAASNSAGTVRVAIPSNWDRDDLTLTYRLYRSGTPGPIQTVSGVSRFWDRPQLSLVDTGLAAGSAQSYRVVVSDPNGNLANSNWMPVVVSTEVLSPYAESVLNDGASLYWRLGGQTGSVESDWTGLSDGIRASDVTSSASGAIVGDTSGSTTFAGSPSSIVSSAQQVRVPSTYSVEAWFKTTTTLGGKIVGYGREATGNSGSYDRHVYMTDSGRLVYGNYDGSTRTLSSSRAFNDGAWHHVVAAQGTDGMVLYVDGAVVGTDSSAKTAEAYVGYWRVGGDNLGGWPNSPSSAYFSGQIDEVAVYPAVLTASQAATHYALGAGRPAPTSSFAATTNNLVAYFDAGTSTAPAGESIASYRWNFGDGTAEGAGPITTHSYAGAGTYVVELTVTSSSGLTSVSTKNVVVTASHAAPVALIAHSTNGLTASFDGRGSTASGSATIASYAWDFGDGSQSTEAQPVHAYGAAGSFSVTLRVTDTTGSSSPAALTTVAVSHAPPVAAFVHSTSGLTVAVDAATSSSSDGQAMTYSWNWGDGSPTTTGVRSSRLYPTSGERTITLTVTDALGASSTATALVAISANAFIAADEFERTLATGWGTAITGGNWSGTTGFSVSAGTGKVTNAASQTRTTLLSGASARDVDARVSFTTDRIANGGGSHFNLIVRKSAAGEYRLKVRTSSTGAVTVNLAKVVGLTETLLTTKVLTGYTAAAGDNLSLRLTAVLVGPSTQLQAKVWPAASPEPSTWTTAITDTQVELQSSGQVGLSTYMAGSVTNGPVQTSLDSFSVK